jgi:hypothetical protein
MARNPVVPARMAARLDGGFVVFVIGMRVNRLWKLRKWLPVARAMGPMLRELFEHPEHGLLGARTLVGWREVTLIQYWRSVEHLERFARDTDLPHREPWLQFFRAGGADGDVGIYHETYLVPAGQYETIYTNMPRIGLAAAGEHVPVSRRGDSAADRRRTGVAEADETR